MRKRKIIIFLFIIIIFIFSILNSDSLLKLKENFQKEKVVNNIKLLETEEEETQIDKKSEFYKLDLLFTGDIMLDRYIRKQINLYEKEEEFVEKFFTNLSVINKKYDYVVANLEGPITENKTKTYLEDGSYTNILHFTFPTTTGKILNLLNIKVVSLANNHTDNFYYEGFLSTKDFLNKDNILFFGNPYNLNTEEESLSKVVCENNICIAYIAYNLFTKVNSQELIKEEILKYKENQDIDFIIIYPHFGEEYELLANSIQVNYAKSWIDAGADLIIGAHPHVIQNKEIYKGKYIYYSLGNYIFDQWFNEDVKKGLALGFTFKKEILANEEVIKDIKLKEELIIEIDKNRIKYLEN